MKKLVLWIVLLQAAATFGQNFRTEQELKNAIDLYIDLAYRIKSCKERCEIDYCSRVFSTWYSPAPKDYYYLREDDITEAWEEAKKSPYRNNGCGDCSEYEMPDLTKGVAAHKRERQYKAVTEVAVSAVNFINAIRQIKNERATEKEKAAYDKTNTLGDAKMFEAYCDFIVAAMAGSKLKFYTMASYANYENSQKMASLLFEGVKVNVVNLYFKNSQMMYTYEFQAANEDYKNALENSGLIATLKKFDRYAGVKGAEAVWENNTFRINTFKLEKSEPFIKMYQTGYALQKYKGAKTEIESVKRAADDEKTKKIKKTISDFEERNYWNSSESYVFTFAKQIGDAYADEQLLNDKALAVLYYKKAATFSIDAIMAGSLFKNDEKVKKNYQNDLANIYFQIGYLIDESDGNEAIDWYKKASGTFKINPYKNIGRIYRYGEGGVAINWNLAREYYEKAAEADDAGAMDILAQLYEKGGPNLEKNESKSKKWRNKACKADKKYCK